MGREQSPPDTSELDIEDIKAFYDEVYYAGARAENSPARPHYKRLVRRLDIKTGASVLDVACGTGAWLRACREQDCRVSGVDLSEKAIKICRALMPEGQFHAQPAETLPFSDNSFDVVTCLGSLEHFIDPLASLREMVRVAHPEATLVILVPNSDFLTRRLGLFAGTYQVDAREVVRTLEEWRALFASAGLEVVERWRDLHVLNRHWITQGRVLTWPLRLLQALALPLWPLRWQYQVYHRCRLSPTDRSAAPVADAN